MSEVRGRIVEVWAVEETRHVALLDRTERHELALAQGLPPLAPGDLVTLSVTEAGATVAAIHGGASGAWDPEGDGTRWRRPAAQPSRMDLLWQRQAILRAVREYFFEQGFLEVQAPLLVKGTCPDVHLDSLSVGDAYLTTSTEYQIKRLVVGGFEKVFTLTQNFRGADVGDRHNPEFTMLEWARAFASLDDIDRDAEALVRRAFRAVHPGLATLRYAGREVAIDGPPWERLTLREAFARHLGMSLDAAMTPAMLRAEVLRTGLAVPASFLADDHLLVSFLVDAVQGHLGATTPTFLKEWPALMTSSAALLPGAPSLADRSELVVAGVELSDGFPSLRDPALQARLFDRERARRAAEGKRPVTLDERYLEALRQGLPPGAGMALGFDRLVMVLTGQTHIRDVIPFAWDEL
jgi:elongation factor P--(R)-beta-lysine ligase